MGDSKNDKVFQDRLETSRLLAAQDSDRLTAMDKTMMAMSKEIEQTEDTLRFSTMRELAFRQEREI